MLTQRIVAKWHRAVNRVVGPSRLSKAAKRRPLRIELGASGIGHQGWTPTEHHYLDITQAGDWAEFFQPDTIDAILAEHVWEHLTPEQGTVAMALAFQYLAPNGLLRIAVPDGGHPERSYIERVKPGGSGPGADDHKALYTCQSLSRALRGVGFVVTPLEWYDEHGRHRVSRWSVEDGEIRRSSLVNYRNEGPAPFHCSLIVDARKPLHVAMSP